MTTPQNNNQHGFTLLEILLTVTLLSILAGLAIPVAPHWQQLTDADVAANTVASSLRRAQALSQAGQADTTWGVSIDNSDNNQIVMFQGASYASRDTSYDEVFDLSGAITVSGVSEVVFAAVSGVPGTTGTITLTTNTNQTRNLVINAKGTVSY